MRTRGVHHVSINVRDADEALRFYVDVLGFRQRDDRPDFPFAGAWLDIDDHDQQLHLLEVDGVEAPRGQHFAISVDDLDAAIEELDARGATVSDPSTIDGICRQAFLADPTGNLIELNQPIAAD